MNRSKGKYNCALDPFEINKSDCTITKYDVSKISPLLPLCLCLCALILTFSLPVYQGDTTLSENICEEAALGSQRPLPLTLPDKPHPADLVALSNSGLLRFLH
jgi:hypothetical protein